MPEWIKYGYFIWNHFISQFLGLKFEAFELCTLDQKIVEAMDIPQIFEYLAHLIYKINS